MTHDTRSRRRLLFASAALSLLAVGGTPLLPVRAQDRVSPQAARIRSTAEEALIEAMRKETGQLPLLNLQTLDDYAVPGGNRGLRGRGRARIKDRWRTFTYDVVVDRKADRAVTTRYNWTDGADDDRVRPMSNRKLRELAQDALQERIRRDSGRISGVRLRTHEEYNLPGREHGLRGTGEATVGSRERTFKYDVRFDTRDDRVTQVRYDWDDERNSSQEDSMVREAKQAVREKIKRDVDNDVRVEFSQAERYTMSGDQVGVRGRGRYRSSSGVREQEFRFDVVINSRTGRTSSVNYIKL